MTKSLKARLLAALSAAVLAVPMAASADVVTQLIHFDNAGNGWEWYTDVDNNFLFVPVNLQSGNCAPSTNGGNGSCLIEGGQTVLTTMTRPTFGPTGDPKDPPTFSGQELFTLNSFYFELSGNGTGSENAITVTGSNSQTFTFEIGSNWSSDSVAPDVFLFSPTTPLTAAGELVKNTGYIASLGAEFVNVQWIRFSAPDSAQVRLDCVVASFVGTTTQPLKDGTTCGIGRNDDGTPVPAPATLALVGLGLLGAAFARRRRSV